MENGNLIPEGITLGTKVCVVNDLPKPLDILFGMHTWAATEYTWVNRGDPIAHVEAKKPFSAKSSLAYLLAKKVKLTIRSPASGLLLHNNPLHYGVRILMPDDEPEPYNYHYIYWHVIDHLDIYSPMYIREHNRSEESLNEVLAIKYQENDFRCSIEEALPIYKDYFEEARTRNYGLRPFLKHLL